MAPLSGVTGAAVLVNTMMSCLLETGLSRKWRHPVAGGKNTNYLDAHEKEYNCDIGCLQSDAAGWIALYQALKLEHWDNNVKRRSRHQRFSVLDANIIGWGAGMVGLVVGHPMDTVKTNQQMMRTKVSNTRIALDLVKKEGVHGLYKGMLFPLLCSGTLNSVFFGIHGYCLRNLQELRGHIPSSNRPTTSGWYLDTFVSGCVGGVGQVIVACPRIFKPGDENNPKRRPRAFLTSVDIFNKNGIRALYVGLVPMLWRDVLSSGLYVWSYQYARFNFHGHLDPNPGPFETLMAGGIAGVLSWMPVVPLDTIKSRVQADDVKNPFYKGMIHCGTELLKEGGYMNFYKGFQMIAIRSFIVNAAIFYAYESMTDCRKHIWMITTE